MMTLAFESFAFKNGIPVAADLVFDVRNLPNPYYDPQLRPLTGLDAPVADYLAQFENVQEMIADIEKFLTKWLLPRCRNLRAPQPYSAPRRASLSICFATEENAPQ